MFLTILGNFTVFSLICTERITFTKRNPFHEGCVIVQLLLFLHRKPFARPTKHLMDNMYDMTAHLVEKFGPIGSETWKAEEDRAWEEYNADILREARKEAGLTQSELAERIGADKAYVSKVEHGRTVPTVSTFYRIVAALGMQVVLTKLPM